MTAIALRSLRKEYNGQVAIPDLDLDIREGEFFTLLGPSGCGKTTLLRMIAGFNSIEAGTIAFDGVVINDKPPAARNIGMVFQNYALFPQMTAARNVAFGLQTRNVSKDESARRVDAALESVHMVHLKDRLPGAMSGGQQQRVALARALVIKPALLLMDEPLSNLDAKLRVEMRHTIREAQREAGITTVYVTHDQEEAMAVSDRIAVMDKGVIRQVGTPRELYHRPADLFVATFVGRTNVLGGVLRTDGSGRTVDVGGARIPLDTVSGSAADGPVQLSIRPEGFVFTEPGAGQLQGVVERSLFLGEKTHYQVRLRSQETVEVVQDSQLVEDTPDGSEVTLAVKGHMVNVFDATGTASLMASGG